MIDKHLSFSLPQPWEGKSFETQQIGTINYLVGPNGSGKSQFASVLFNQLNQGGNARVLGTDRLSGMEQTVPLRDIVGDTFGQGFSKNLFPHLRTAGKQGSGIDTIVLLEERMDLRIQIEATLSHLFDREILLEWDSGNLVPKMARRGGGASYRLDRGECHGIKELLVLLTHLYNDEYSHLIIDEPELNLHPQYQAFFMQEVRKLVGDPTANKKKKVVFLITHSPFMLDLRSENDLKSIISFNLEYSVPKQVANLGLDIFSLASFMGRLNAYHKQLFFSDNPIFVEGILDARLVEAMMEARGVSVAGAGSCIIDAGGAEEVNHFLKLCQGLGKRAYFLYDLDSLFRGNLRACIREDQSVQSFLASAGLGNDFGEYCGKLDRKLTCLIDQLLKGTLSTQLVQLGNFLSDLGKRDQWDKGQWAKARTAVMTAISLYREDVESVSKEDVADIEGRLGQIIVALKEKNIHLLPGGTIERYLPSYKGDDYKLAEDTKQQAVSDEIQKLWGPMTEAELSSRYGELYDVVCDLPSKANVDVEGVLRIHLGRYIHELQTAAVTNLSWKADQLQQHLSTVQPSIAKVFSIQKFERNQDKQFSAVIEIAEMVDQKRRVARVSNQTNAGIGDFQIESA